MLKISAGIHSNKGQKRQQNMAVITIREALKKHNPQNIRSSYNGTLKLT